MTTHTSTPGAARTYEPSQTTAPPRVLIVNPLPVTLAHYESELLETLALPPNSVTVRHVDAEGKAGLNKLAALGRYIRAARQSVATGGTVLVAWPLLGWLDLVLYASTRRAAAVYVIVHDPKPLRRQIGLGPAAAALARVLRRAQPHLICHSSLAAEHTISQVRNARVTVLPHPVLPALPATNRPTPSRGQPIHIGVFGQYKESRDLELLHKLGGRLAAGGGTGTIKGRGWPRVAGWNVDSRFLSEDELTQSLRASNVVLIPYSRYYQSGIAIRALEEGTPVVGRRHTFLESLLGAAYPGLVDSESTDEWLAAIERVVSRAHSVDLRGRAIRSEWEVVTGRRT